MTEETGPLGDSGRVTDEKGDVVEGNDTTDSETTASNTNRERKPVHITRGLVDVLLDMAEDAEPTAMNLVLAPTPAGDFDTDLNMAPETPVLTHFYMAEAGGSVSAVFGVDLGTPAGRGRARFITHPQGPLELTRRDDLAAVVLVAVPPWEERTLAAFDRAGRKLDIVVVDAEPPEEEL